ncbi:MAG: alkaline phosphatase family protein [Ruminococcaceae bacterium]|nr:alkaline phosphatase family protein [Oscillospiraceae bacterium]
MRQLSKDGFDRVLIHNPDAVGMWLYQDYPDAFLPVLKHTHLTVPLCSPMQSVTPVCFGTMYTGAAPSVHGIQEYAKPVIQIDTFFDAAVRAGKRVAMIAPPTCSLSNIFIGHGIEYYHCACEGEIIEKAQQLIAKDEHDIICVYTYMFDTLNHRNGPFHPETQNALYRQGQYFDILAATVKRLWKHHNTLISYSPDHGVHEVVPYGSELNSKGKPVRGHHGSDCTQDRNILHYMGVIRRSDKKD